MSEETPENDESLNMSPDAGEEAKKRAHAKKMAVQKARAQKIQQKQETIAKRQETKQEWNNPKGDWSKGQMQKAQAHLTTVFETDENSLPLSKHLLLITITSFFIIFVVWANLANLDEVARGQGKVIPSSEVQALQSLESGIVEEFLVKEGQEVAAGEVLVRLSDIEASSDLGANKARYLGLLASISRLQAEAEGHDTLDFPDEVKAGAPESVTEELNAFRANRQQVKSQLNILEQQLTQRKQEVNELETKITDIRAVIRLQEEEKALIAPLVERGSAPRMELLQLDRGIKQERLELNAAMSSLPRVKAAIEEVQARIEETKDTVRADSQTELTGKQVELREIKERLSALTERKTRTELKSPVNGTVQEITVNTVGGVVRAGEDIIKIVPKDDQLIIEAKIRPSDRAFIYPTQKAIIKITAYDFSIYGGLEGEVLDISADTVEDEEGNDFFRVKLRTFDTELKRGGETYEIIPGMIASVDILTGEKTVMQYLLKPFFKTLDQAFSER